eukprot:TRINITY_DN7501_c0_g1_i2.p1 TRINITY_DN7501_c0_g1~~TRINITY_DN7501_c0_g1_i2.p1  ORF type:complete len:149 (-),score=29.61 TRINITY_DN7501_c0_g1_i2:242-688(-)
MPAIMSPLLAEMIEKKKNRTNKQGLRKRERSDRRRRTKDKSQGAQKIKEAQMQLQKPMANLVPGQVLLKKRPQPIDGQSHPPSQLPVFAQPRRESSSQQQPQVISQQQQQQQPIHSTNTRPKQSRRVGPRGSKTSTQPVYTSAPPHHP